EEPPAPELRPMLEFECGLSAAETNAPVAVEHLSRAYEGLTDPEAKATAAFALAQSQLFIGAPKAGGALARRAAEALGDALADLRQMLESIELLAVFFGADPKALARIDEPRVGDGVGAKMLTAAQAFAAGATGRPAHEVEALVLESFAGRLLVASGNGLSWSAATAALTLCETARAPELF